MAGFLKRFFSPTAAAREDVERFLASQPTPDAIFEFLKKRTGGREAFEIIRAREDPACAEALQKWREWRLEQHRKKNLEIISQLRTESESYLTSLGEEPRAGEGVKVGYVPGMGAIPVLDLRSDRDRQIEEDARSGVSIGPVFDALVAEVIGIGRSAEFTVLEEHWTAAYDAKRRHRRVYEIGTLLNAGGGMVLMQAAACRVRATGGDGRDLDRCWAGLGGWQH